MRLALGEYDTGWQNPQISLDRAADLVGRAAAAGARLLVLPEMCPSGFTMDSARFAEPLDGRSATRLAGLARDSGIWILAGMATRRTGRAYNSALLLNPSGQLAAAYDKQKVFDYAGEGASYTAGEGPVVFEVDGVRLSPFVCFDLRFPELFRAVGVYVDVLLVIANWPAARQMHWDVLLPARAIENQAYLVGVNRTGRGALSSTLAVLLPTIRGATSSAARAPNSPSLTSRRMRSPGSGARTRSTPTAATRSGTARPQPDGLNLLPQGPDRSPWHPESRNPTPRVVQPKCAISRSSPPPSRARLFSSPEAPAPSAGGSSRRYCSSTSRSG